MKLIERDTMIPCADGGERRYVTTPLPFDTAYKLGLKLSEMIGGSAGAAFAALFTGDDAEGLDAQAAPAMANALAGLPRALLAAGPDLLNTVLASTWTPDEDAGKKLGLGEPKNRTIVWGGGLSQEPFRVIGHVLWVNFGPLLPGGSEGLEPLLAKARTWWKNFGQENKEKPETEPSKSGDATKGAAAK